MASVFTRIINGDLPGHVPYRDGLCFVLMSINPISPGHCLVIPRTETDQWSDLEPDLAAHLMVVAQRVSRALHTAFPCERVGLIIAGFEVPHCHLHVIPANGMHDLDFARAATHVDHDELARHAESLAKLLS